MENSMPESFEQKIEKQVVRFQTQKYEDIERSVATKRIDWVKKNFGNVSNNVSPRQAFEILFLDYMGLDKSSLPVLTETEDMIEWSSQNSCPTLEACNRLKLDTRHICKTIYEKSTQAFLSGLNPQLRFYRDYEEIRPYSFHCREKIIQTDFGKYMNIAIEEARLSKNEGNKGYGAVVVYDREILSRSHDTAITENDPSMHAEVNAIRESVKTKANPNLSGAILFSTCEPCPMCTSLAVWSNLTTIIFGASIEETSKMGRTRINISSRDIVDKSPTMIEIIGGEKKEDCLRLYQY
jgi:tRNA(Arg) A34 adenosine deaminase TadA